MDEAFPILGFPDTCMFSSLTLLLNRNTHTICNIELSVLKSFTAVESQTLHASRIARKTER